MGQGRERTIVLLSEPTLSRGFHQTPRLMADY